LIFLTVGSMFPFDRLIRGVDDLISKGLVTESVYAQIGNGEYEPRHMPFARFVEKADFDGQMKGCSVVISHAGIGTISTALHYGRTMIVLPRLKAFGEHVNDHQVGTARKYAELGHVILSDSVGDLPTCLEAARRFQPIPRHVNTQGIVSRIGRFIDGMP
jgi:beta-1,4-N-acetylglucosaminyltransferase